MSKTKYVPYIRGFYAAFRGLTPLPDEEVLDLYGGTFHVPLQQDSGFYGKARGTFFIIF